MKQLLNSRMQDELELGRPATNVWEKVFRLGVSYLLIATLVGVVAERIFGSQGKDSAVYPWIWILIVPYLFFMVYCSNYAVGRYVRSRVVKIAWFLLMALLALIVGSDLLSSRT